MKKLVLLFLIITLAGCSVNNHKETERHLNPSKSEEPQQLSGIEREEARLLLDYFNKSYTGSDVVDTFYVDIDNDNKKELLIALNTYSGADMQSEKEARNNGFDFLYVAVVFPKDNSAKESVIVLANTFNKGTRFFGKGLFRPTVKNGKAEKVDVIAKNNNGVETNFPVFSPVRLKEMTAFIAVDTALYTEPNGKVIRKDLVKGRVVTLISTQEAWANIAIYTYDTPSDNVGWVKAGVLSYYPNGFKPVEGQTRTEILLFDGPGPVAKSLPDKVVQHSPVFIIKREKGWIHGRFAGGLDGWIPEDSVEYIGPTVSH